MLLSLSWLKEWINYNLSDKELAERLTLSGTEVEKIKKWGINSDQIKVGEIIKLTPHPKSQKLQIAKVKVGSLVFKVVLGAFNVKVKDKVAIALPGSILPNGVKISSKNILGITSEGMLLAEDELGIGEDHSGIFILPSKLPSGASLRKVLDIEDTIFDLDITPNRSDCLSILGIAREVSALTSKKIKKKIPVLKDHNDKEINQYLKVEVNVPYLCPKYTARYITGVKVESSPWWVKKRLLALGLRPVNNIVDITNYVMLELGQPLHAFDADKLKSDNKKKIIKVRKAYAKEKITTLDDKLRILDNSCLVIADLNQPIALAGVMGGKNTQITSKTKNVILESAIFDPLTIRRIRQKYRIVSESAYRFERGIDFDLPEKALDYATFLIQKIAQGRVIKGRIYKSYQKRKPIKIQFNPSFASQLLGANIKKNYIEKVLKNLNCQITKKKNIWEITPPSYRSDLKIPSDLVEEIGRIYDYNRLKPQPLRCDLKYIPLDFKDQIIQKIKNNLIYLGFTEVYNYSFYSKETVSKFGFKINDHFRIINPLNPNQEFLRISLIPLLIQNITKNSPLFDRILIFETGRVFLRNSSFFPKQPFKLALAFYSRQEKNVFYFIKGVLENLFKNLGFSDDDLDLDKKRIFSFLNPARSAYFEIKNKKIGWLGELNEALKQVFKIKGSLALAELDLEKITTFPQRQFKEIPLYPPVLRDISLVVNKEITYKEIKRILTSHPLVSKVELFDVFENERVLGKNKKSLAFHLYFQDPQKTLTKEEVDKVFNHLVEKLQKKLKAFLRQK